MKQKPIDKFFKDKLQIMNRDSKSLDKSLSFLNKSLINESKSTKSMAKDIQDENIKLNKSFVIENKNYNDNNNNKLLDKYNKNIYDNIKNFSPYNKILNISIDKNNNKDNNKNNKNIESVKNLIGNDNL